MHTDFEPLVHIDWKLPGEELLALFQHYYPDVPVFSGATFETLLDELSNQTPELCFQALAPLLLQHGFDLWNLDAGGDDYRPVLIPCAQRQAFAQYWQHSPGELELTANLIAPTAPTKSTAKKPKQRKLKWLHEVHDYPADTYVDEHRYSHGWASITEEDEGRWLCFLIDYNPWPPVEQDMLEQRSDGVDGADLQLIDANADRSLWRRKCFSGLYAGEELHQYEIRRGEAIQPFGPAEVQWPEFEEPSVVVGEHIFERQRLYEPEHLTRIWRITASSSEVIFESSDELTILPIGDRRLLFMQHHGRRCWVYHLDQAQPPVAGKTLPVVGDTLRAATAYLGADELLLFSEGHRQNAEDAGYRETVLLAWRFNLSTGATCKAVLDGFGSELRQETQLFVTQPKRSITLRTFHGQLQVSQGHDDWWIWNYQASTLGTHTVAWLWNQRSDQALKLSSKDFPRLKPQLRYVPAQDRYLAFERLLVARLPPFSEMLEARGADQLSFE